MVVVVDTCLTCLSLISRSQSRLNTTSKHTHTVFLSLTVSLLSLPNVLMFANRS